MITGPRFFPTGFAGAETNSKTRKARNRHHPSGETQDQLLRRQVKARLRLWKRMREVLIHHNSIPAEEEALLLEIAEQQGVKDNEDGLEGWTAYQLLNKVSEGATRGFEVLTLAVEDIVASLSSKGSHKYRIRCSNVTQWRPEVQQWLQAQRDDVILVQETHLNRPSLQAAMATMHKAG